MEPFTSYHFFWLGLTVVFVIGCINMKRLPLDSRWHRVLRTVLFALLVINESSWFCYRHVVAQIPLVENLPLHLCDLSVFTMLFTLVTGRKLFAELAYYMGVVGALLAVCFPSIAETGDIRTIAEIRYFITHIALVGGGFYFTFGRQYHPKIGAILRSYLFIHLYALLVTPLNLSLGTNYFFVLSAPKQLGWIRQYPHWLFLVVVSLIFLFTFFLMNLPFMWQRRHSTSRERGAPFPDSPRYRQVDGRRKAPYRP